MDFARIANDNRILEIMSGSHMFGTNTPESDQDFVGIFLPTEEMLYGFQECEVVNINKAAKDETGRNTADAIDRTLYEFRKFCKLAMENNPNILNVLFASKNSVVYSTEFGEVLRSKAELFPHKGCFHRYVSYARSQRHKMVLKPENYNQLVSALAILKTRDDKNRPIVWLAEDGLLNWSEESKKHIRVGDLQLDCAIQIKKAISMIEKRVNSAGNRRELITKYGFDTKFGSNLIMLLRQGIELLNTGKLVLPLPYAQEILDIKRGRYSAQEVIELSEKLEKEAEVAFSKSTLPEHPRHKEIEDLVVKINKWSLMEKILTRWKLQQKEAANKYL